MQQGPVVDVDGQDSLAVGGVARPVRHQGAVHLLVPKHYLLRLQGTSVQVHCLRPDAQAPIVQHLPAHRVGVHIFYILEMQKWIQQLNLTLSKQLSPYLDVANNICCVKTCHVKGFRLLTARSQCKFDLWPVLGRKHKKSCPFSSTNIINESWLTNWNIRDRVDAKRKIFSVLDVYYNWLGCFNCHNLFLICRKRQIGYVTFSKITHFFYWFAKKGSNSKKIYLLSRELQ